MQRSSGTFLFFTFLLLLTGTMFASLLVLMPSYPVIGGHARNAFVFEWDLWWLGKANMNQTPFHTPFLFSPRGTSLIPFVLYPLPSLLFQPIVRLFGIHTAYNFLLIFLFLANGGVLYIFFRELFRDQEEMELQAFFATGILLTSGWVYGAFAGAYLHIASFWVPGILGWLLFRWLRQPSWERFFLFVMGWVLAVYTDIQMTLLSFLILFPLSIFWFWNEYHIITLAIRKTGCLRILTGLLLGFVLILPYILPAYEFSKTFSHQEILNLKKVALQNNAHVLDWISWKRHAMVYGNEALEWVRNMSYPGGYPSILQKYGPTPGLVTLLLFISGLFLIKQNRRAFRTGFFLFIIGVIFSFGPVLTFLGKTYSLPLMNTFWNLDAVVLLSRAPVRWALPGLFGCAILVPSLLVHIKKCSPIIFKIIILLWVIESFPTPHFPVQFLPLNKIEEAFVRYDARVKLPRYATILHLPPEWPPGSEETLLYWNFNHKHPIVGGFLNRSLEATPYQNEPIILDWFQKNYDDILAVKATPQRLHEFLSAYNIYVLYIHTRFAPPFPDIFLKVPRLSPRTKTPHHRRLFNWLKPFRPGTMKLAGGFAYILSPYPKARTPYVALGKGWYDVEREGSRRWRWIGNRPVSIIVWSEKKACIRLMMTGSSYKRPVRIVLRNTGIQNRTRTRSDFVLFTPEVSTQSMYLDIEPGWNDIILKPSPDSPKKLMPPHDPRPLTVSISRILVKQC